jgi:hypothetical protein
MLSSKDPRVASSEDRSFHCGYNHPEAVSVCHSIVSRISGCLPMISASSVVRCNTKRKVVFPFNFDEMELLEGVEYEMMTKREQNIEKKVPVMSLLYHAQQGQHAIGLGIINTICNIGLMEMAKELTNEIKESYIITTQDDVGRLIRCKLGCDMPKVKYEAIDKPLMLMNHFMMINNARKWVESEKLMEVNNILTTAEGMVSQGPIHSVLVNQPLSGETPLEDLMTVIAEARATVFWGDTPNLANSALIGGLDQLRQRWLLSFDQIESLYDFGLVPDGTAELLEGFYPRNDKVLSAIWNLHDDEEKESILKGEKSLMTKLINGFKYKRLENKESNKRVVQFEPKENKDLIMNYEALYMTKFKLKSVESAKETGGTLRAEFVQSKPVAKRIEFRNNLMRWLNDCEPMDVELESLKKATKPPIVNLHIRPMVKRDKLPCYIGTCAPVNSDFLSGIKCYRYLGIDYKKPLTENERRLSQLPDEEFKKYMQEELNKDKRLGFTVKSPSGLPTILYESHTKYTKPYSFSFSVDVEGTYEKRRMFTYRGIDIKDFSYCFWGNASLHRSRGMILAFGYGKINGVLHCFFKRKRGPVVAIEIDPNNPFQQIRLSRDTTVSILLKIDMSPIVLTNWNIVSNSSVPGFIGDQIALDNYGGWLHTNSRTAFSLMQKVFEKFESSLPNNVREFLPNYPVFPNTGVTEFQSAANYVLEGHKCIRKLKVKFIDTDTIIKINLTTDTPFEAFGYDVDGDVDFGEY